jgi:hypothetical protein
MLKALLFGTTLSILTLSAASALPRVAATDRPEIATSNVVEIGHTHWRRYEDRRRGHADWKGWYHSGRYWRHRYYHRPYHWRSCLNIGPIWYCP